MSLLRLLTTGKSLVGVRDSETRYRVTRQRFLPRFGPTTNPFCGAATTNPPQPDDGADAGAASPLCQEKTTGVSRSLVPAVLVGSQRRQLRSALRSRAIALRNAWAGKLAALVSRTRGKATAVATSRPSRLAVQGELSLEQIKVVRNDLSDADLEVVPAKLPAGQASAASNLQGVDRGIVGGRAWGRVSGLFRAGKT
jgi:hypothetical protein